MVTLSAYYSVSRCIIYAFIHCTISNELMAKLIWATIDNIIRSAAKNNTFKLSVRLFFKFSSSYAIFLILFF